MRLFKKSERISPQFDRSENEKLISSAFTYYGVAYRLGGTDAQGMDCSGLLFRIYSDQQYTIPRVTYQQASYGFPISLNSIEKGDWLFFKTNGSDVINHVGLVSNIRGPQELLFIHASTTKGVREDNLYSDYWFKSFVKVIRPFKNNSN